MKTMLIARSPSVDIKPLELRPREYVKINFLAILESEVKSNPKQAKKFKNLLSTTSMVCLSMLMLADPTMAETMAPTPTPPNIDPDLVNTLIILMLSVAGLGVLASVVALMLAGVWKMFFGGSSADQWRQNIYRGLAQVLLAPVSVALVVGLAMLLFSTIPAFHPLVKPIQAWFQM
ncbi:hypothetical protein BC351_00430 [Paenibacillus ferrarius]|uniref:Uncharacterized protein n=1 Tax=Paenibacillus ferrarius TaxID=1469647 RepID=A0A1V4HSD8_9BACL|nr:hypothetical protein [Paenibacillus ferrarius]OPH61742.1 hypothetical protein BC351_00430 [Paenibacillus ferrarius]